MKFKEYLSEAKPIGSKNKEIWQEYLKEKYSKDFEKLYK